jgi:alpha-1,2-mannosyltransferase
LPLRAAVLASSTLVAVPLAFFYELMLTAVAGAWLIRAERDGTMPRWEKVALVSFLLLVLLGKRFAGALHAPIEPLAVIVLFLVAAIRACAKQRGTAE